MGHGCVICGCIDIEIGTKGGDGTQEEGEYKLKRTPTNVVASIALWICWTRYINKTLVLR